MDSEVRVSLRGYDDSIDEAYTALFPGDPDKSLERLNWRFRDNPHGSARFAVATHKERIVGLIALIPTRLINMPGEGSCFQAIDTVVDRSFQGRGLFVKMGMLAQQPTTPGCRLLWGFPNAKASPGWYGRLGWTNFGSVPLLMRPLRSSFLFGRLHSRLRSVDLPLVRQRIVDSFLYERGEQIAADFETFWREVSPQFGIAVDRSGEWMRWRLFDKPGARYRCVGLKSGGGELEAFAATKIADKHGSRLSYVMEAIAAPGRTAKLQRLLLAELGHAAREGAEAALAWCPRNAPNYSAYRRAGFLPVPGRLRPIEINFGARALDLDGAAATVRDARWYISLLDSDTN